MLGALGITLGLSLLETLLVVAIGNVLGCALFGLLDVIGHRTAVNQMVLGRAPFGRRGAIVPGVVQCLLTMAWVGVNTWVVLDLALAVLAKIGITGGIGLEYLVAAVIMLAQLGLALYGFYAIRTFEKWTVPLTVLVMAAMTVLALSSADLHWTAATAETPAEKFTAMTQLTTAIGVGWGITWLPYSADYSRFVRPEASSRSVFWASALGRDRRGRLPGPAPRPARHRRLVRTGRQITVRAVERAGPEQPGSRAARRLELAVRPRCRRPVLPDLTQAPSDLSSTRTVSGGATR